MEITIDVPDDTRQNLEPLKDNLPQILVLGLQKLTANPSTGFTGLKEIWEFLTSLTPPSEVLVLRLFASVQGTIDQHEGLSATEQQIW